MDNFDHLEALSNSELIAKIKNLRIYLNNILTNVPGSLYLKDTDGVYLDCNDVMVATAGLNFKSEIIGKTDFELWPEQAPKIRENDLEVISSGKQLDVEETVTILSGEVLYFAGIKAPLLNESGEVIGILGNSLNITDRKRQNQELQDTKQKLEGMTIVTATIAHELRTPLSSLELAVDNLKEYLPTLLESYHAAEKLNLVKRKLKPNIIELFADYTETMHREIRSSALAIDMIFEKIKPDVKNNIDSIFSIAHCVNEALRRYPFNPAERRLVHWEPKNDFFVQGKELSVTHILFNFVKNALHAIVAAGKGNINIWLETSELENKLYFKDTGKGISADILPKIFEQFVSHTVNGTGIGLTYCDRTMKSLNGRITCDSIEGSYTLFTLYFPLAGKK